MNDCKSLQESNLTAQQPSRYTSNLTNAAMIVII